MSSGLFDKASQHAPGYYSPSQTALLLLDYKDLVIDKIGNRAHDTVEVAANMRQWANSKGIEVIHCLVDFHGSPPISSSKEADRLSKLAASVKKNGGDGQPEEIAPRSDELVLKRRMGYISALQSSGIKEHLHQQGIKSLILMGLSTGGCVLRTSFDASENGFVTTVVSDGCADANNELHEFLFANMFARTAFVSSSSGLQKGYDELY